MKSTLIRCSFYSVLASSMALGQAEVGFTNFIRQIQYPSATVHDVGAAAASPVSGGTPSSLAIDPGGARFELWTVKSDPLTSYLLDHKYVGASAPLAEVKITTEDTDLSTGIPRTRADRPFTVDIRIDGLVTLVEQPTAPKSLLSVKLLRHVQSYGEGGTDTNIDRGQASLIKQESLTQNADYQRSYAVTSIPNGNLIKIRGEERFSVFSLADQATKAPESQLASQRVQVWPVADATIAGIANNAKIRYSMPDLTLSMRDLYPNSQTFAQIYKGAESLGTVGIKLPPIKSVYGSVPVDAVLILKGNDLDAAITDDGKWTLEILTSTPFGIDRLAHVSFSVDRKLKVNSSVTTVE